MTNHRPVLPAPPPPVNGVYADGTTNMPKPVRSPYHTNGSFKKGNSKSCLVQDPQDLLDCYEEYEAEALETKNPVNLYAFIAYAQRPFGIDNRWWQRYSLGIPKNKPLVAMVLQIEARVASHLATEGLGGRTHAGMATHMLNTLQTRDALVGERQEAAEKAAKAKADAIPPEQIANIIHPDMTHEQLAELERAGIKPILYTQQQLEAGMPLMLPMLALNHDED